MKGALRPIDMRLAMGASALLSTSEVLDLLGMRRDEAEGWLRTVCHPHVIAGRERWRWGDVLDASKREGAVKGGSNGAPPPSAQQGHGLRRASLVG